MKRCPNPRLLAVLTALCISLLAVSAFAQFQTGNIDHYVTSLQHFGVSNWALQDTKTFRPSLLNEFRIGVQRYDSPTTALGNTQLSDFGANYHGVMIPQTPRGSRCWYVR